MLYFLVVFLVNLWVVLEFAHVFKSGAASSLPLAVVLIVGRPAYFLKSQDFAVLLGLPIVNPQPEETPEANLNFPVGQEFKRKERFMHYLRWSGSGQTQDQQDIIWSKFCALYLPATIDRLLDLPVPTDAMGEIEQAMVADFSSNNPWHEMLVRIQHIPYFAKYLRSSSLIAAAGKRLPQILADRLTNVSAKWEKDMTEVTQNAVNTTSLLRDLQFNC
ncbi:hypothetical protein B0H17DRAFT_1207624 [Mycena rosella]|uniref:Uncharacterized protein n=1 Tax=Mycena rosella TaxID=1033263 RepID=A0AAD7GC73_MYCRO|nr:hypothetical protein B0H17DRAFT_1207624 [Mycena rosella]